MFEILFKASVVVNTFASFANLSKETVYVRLLLVPGVFSSILLKSVTLTTSMDFPFVLSLNSFKSPLLILSITVLYLSFSDFSSDNSVRVFLLSSKFLIAFLQNSLKIPSLRSNPICPSDIMIGLRPSTKSV